MMREEQIRYELTGADYFFIGVVVIGLPLIVILSGGQIGG